MTCETDAPIVKEVLLLIRGNKLCQCTNKTLHTTSVHTAHRMLQYIYTLGGQLTPAQEEDMYTTDKVPCGETEEVMLHAINK